jgi:hypothetical protein
MQAICKLLLGAARKNRGRDGNKTIAIRIVQEDCGKERERRRREGGDGGGISVGTHTGRQVKVTGWDGTREA